LPIGWENPSLDIKSHKAGDVRFIKQSTDWTNTILD